MRVKANSMGFYGGIRRRIGDVFEIREGEKPSGWMTPTDEPLKKSKPKAKAVPETLADMTPAAAAELV